MSFKAMAWASEQEITQTAPQSHLLLILASFANEQNECYPSIGTMVNKTRLSEKTVRKCLKELADLGLIFDTKKVSHFGAKIYQINLDPPSKSTTPSKNTTPSKSTSTPLVNLPSGGSKFTSTPLVNLPPNPIIEPIIEPINNHKSECDTHTHTHENQNLENQKNSKSDKPIGKSGKKPNKKFITADDLVALGVDLQVAQDYLATRKTKLTQTALNLIIKQCQLANIDLNSALQFCIEYSWQSFKADWYFNRIGENKSFGNNSNRNNSNRNTQNQLSRMDELRHMANTNPTNVFVDDLPPNLPTLGASYE